MDSVSQFVLGAAVGEAVLGRKIGNKAMLIGGIAGTIPDLDVLTGPFLSEVDSLAMHRGISHSILFSILGALFFGFLLHKFYQRRKNKLLDNSIKELSPTHNEWRWFFFLAFFTHIILDCFTMYGTQLLAPFSNFRVAFSTVAVADVFYTIPFIFCLIRAAFLPHSSPKRRHWNWAGILISSLYLCFTIANKKIVSNTFETQLEAKGISYSKSILGPTILTNFLWNMTYETDEAYYQGQYSVFDKSPITFNRIEKNHELIAGSDNDRTIQILKWFTNDFYNVVPKKDGNLQFNDLRYGTFRGIGDGENDYIFRFAISKLADGSYHMSKTEGGPAKGEESKMMSDLWTRIKGN